MCLEVSFPELRVMSYAFLFFHVPRDVAHHECASNRQVCIVDCVPTQPFCVSQSFPEWCQTLLNSFTLLCLLRLISSILQTHSVDPESFVQGRSPLMTAQK